jgi:hypothetical protein
VHRRAGDHLDRRLDHIDAVAGAAARAEIEMNGVALVLRWLHIVPAVMGGGAAFFAALALLPTLREMPEPTRSAIRSAVADRWRPVLSASIGLLLLSGIANFVLFQGPAHAGQALYLALFGVKVLAALGVFFLASALMGRSEALQPVRDNGALWTKVNAGLVLLVLLISGVLRTLPPNP